MSKGKKGYRIFMAAIIVVLVCGITLLVAGIAQQNQQAYLYSTQRANFDNKLTNIADVYARSGIGDQTREAVDFFLQQMPQDWREGNNILILDQGGEIQYRY